ncbi:MAG TPA: alkane 1-monooxygenase [Enhygromyxa sp.]|nr:alkane 1-monooxygenase [Enhygromyxa sp.]
MIRVIPFFLVFMLPAMLVLGVERGGAWTLAPVLFSFGVIPILDVVLEQRRENPGDPERAEHDWGVGAPGESLGGRPAHRRASDDDPKGYRRVFDVPVLAWVPVQLAATIYVLHGCVRGDRSGLEIAALVLSLGIVNGAGGINLAHELMHRKHPLHRAAAEMLMTSVSYTHFCVEHVLGHHRHVATPEDPASSRLGESFYRFYPRTVIGGLRSAWALEGERCRSRGLSSFDLRNRRLRYPLVLAAVYVGVSLLFGPLGLGLFVAQGVIAFSLLEVINYIEHYGLARRRLASGKYERVRPEHSWNSAHRVSNYYLFNLARHSDHHYLASREYDRLRHRDDAPQLPTGYAGMLLLALVPPLWFRVMDPRVQAWNARAGADPQVVDAAIAV